MSVNSANIFQTLILRIRTDIVLLLLGIVLFTDGNSVYAIDYFEINNPKFVPVKVGLAADSSAETTSVQNVLKANLGDQDEQINIISNRDCSL